MKQYTDFQKKSVGGAIKVLAESLKTVFDEVHFLVNLLHQNAIKSYLYFRWFVIFWNLMALATAFVNKLSIVLAALLFYYLTFALQRW